MTRWRAARGGDTGGKLIQAHLGKAVAEGVAGEAEQAGGLALVAVGAAEGFADDLLLVLIEGHAFGQEVSVTGGAWTRGVFELDVGGIELGGRCTSPGCAR